MADPADDRVYGGFVKILRIPWLVLIAFEGPILAESSQELRKNRTVQVVGCAGFSGFGISGGWFLPDDGRIDLSLSKSDFAYLAFDERSTKLEFQSFKANSLYYAVGMNQRDLKWKSAYSSVVTFKDSSVDNSHIRSTSAYFVIGNEWTLKYFVIGGEWFGLSQPILWQIENDYNSGVSDFNKSQSDRLMTQRVSQMTLIGPSLTLGFSF